MRSFAKAAVGNHRAVMATVVTVVLFLSGAAVVGVALQDQHHAPQPPLTTSPVTVPTKAPARVTAAKVVGPVMPASTPLTITIPAIDVHSYLLQLGRTTGGALEVPPEGPSYNTAGWYKYSPTPGALGPAVIAGHVDSAADGASIFYRLGGLHRGDTVNVGRADNTVATFTVDDVLRYHKTAFPTQVVYGNTDHAALRLITCGGQFDTATGHYTDNIVVLASLDAGPGTNVVG